MSTSHDPKKFRTKQELRAVAVTMKALGHTNQEITRETGFPARQIQRWKKKADEGSLMADSPKSGRPRSVRTVEMSEKITEMLHAQPLASLSGIAKLLKSEGHTISRSTVHRISQEAGLFPYRISKTVELTAEQMAERVEWARNHLNMTAEEWSNVLFSDEHYLALHHTPNGQNERVYLYRGERASSLDLLREAVPQFDAHLMLWVGLTGHGKCDLHFVPQGTKMDASYYVESILKPIVRPAFPPKHDRSLFTKGQLACFQQDHASIHDAHLTQHYLRDAKVHFFPKDDWPPKSPDLSIAENALSMLTAGLSRFHPQTLVELRASATQVWEEIDQSALLNMAESMPTRLGAVLAAKGATLET